LGALGEIQGTIFEAETKARHQVQGQDLNEAHLFEAEVNQGVKYSI